MLKGILVTFEGIDGCGKTTQSCLFHKHLRARNVPAVLIKEPGGTKTGLKIRNILLHSRTSISPWCELFLYLASRAQLVQERLIPSLRQGLVVILDRHTDSTIAYQGYGRGLPVSLLKILHRTFLKDLKPDLTFLIDEKTENLRPIMQKKKKDRMERESILFQEKVREGYLEISRKEKQRVKVIKRGTPKETFLRILQVWENFIHERGRTKEFPRFSRKEG